MVRKKEFANDEAGAMWNSWGSGWVLKEISGRKLIEMKRVFSKDAEARFPGKQGLDHVLGWFGCFPGQSLREGVRNMLYSF